MSDSDPLATLRAARLAATRAVIAAEAEFVSGADHPQAETEAMLLIDLAERMAADVGGWIRALGRIDPALTLKGGRRLATADHCDWLQQAAEDLAQPMTAPAARLFLTAVNRAGM